MKSAFLRQVDMKNLESHSHDTSRNLYSILTLTLTWWHVGIIKVGLFDFLPVKMKMLF
jgi:hypothetical protein